MSDKTVIAKRVTRSVRLSLENERADKLRRVADNAGRSQSSIVEQFIDMLDEQPA